MMPILRVSGMDIPKECKKAFIRAIQWNHYDYENKSLRISGGWMNIKKWKKVFETVKSYISGNP